MPEPGHETTLDTLQADVNAAAGADGWHNFGLFGAYVWAGDRWP